jgi:hypothetical protein
VWVVRIMLVALTAAGWAVLQYHLVFGEMFPPPDEEFSLLVPPIGFFLFALLFGERSAPLRTAKLRPAP